LGGDSRRLATYASLGITEISGAEPNIIAQVLQDCNQYFHRRPYRSWFDALLPTLEVCGASYYNDTACHLDLVQWATNPKWSKLKASVKKSLLAEDAAFLESQLRNENIRLLLVNGNAVWKELKSAMRNNLMTDDSEIIDGHADTSTRLYTGGLFGTIKVIAWSANLQSSWGHQVTDALRAELVQRVKRFVHIGGA
jgi:hypothetical protein